jgi:hypothetical protein
VSARFNTSLIKTKEYLMKTKILAFFRQNIRATRYRLAALKPRTLLWLARHSTIFNKIYPNTPKRRFFIMKAKLVNFYQTNVQPKLAAVKAGLVTIKDTIKAKLTAARTRLVRTKQCLTSWLKRHRSELLAVGGLLVALMIVVGLAYLWPRSPRLQAAVRRLAAVVVALLAGLWAFLKAYGSRLWGFLKRPFQTAPPIIVTAQSAIRDEQPSPASDGRL